MKQQLKLLALALTLFPAWACAADNTLTAQEKREAWKLLFDGKTFAGFRDPGTRTPPGSCWVIENATIRTRRGRRITEDLTTLESYGDFELKFDFKLAAGGNSGVKYRVQTFIFMDSRMKGRSVEREVEEPAGRRSAPGAEGFEYPVGFEFQLLDGQPQDPRTGMGALYGFLAPDSYPAHPAGQWNSAMLLIRGTHFEHWINGRKVLDDALDSQDIRAAAEKRWAEWPTMRRMFTDPKPEGPICFQYHNSEVFFKNVKIRRIPQSTASRMRSTVSTAPGRLRHVGRLTLSETVRCHASISRQPANHLGRLVAVVKVPQFQGVVRPVVREWRRTKGLPEDPLAAFRASGYLERVGREPGAMMPRPVAGYC